MDVVQTPPPPPTVVSVPSPGYHHRSGIALAIGIAAGGFFIGLGIFLAACMHGHMLREGRDGMNNESRGGRMMQMKLDGRQMQRPQMQSNGGDRVMFRAQPMAPETQGGQTMPVMPPGPQGAPAY